MICKDCGMPSNRSEKAYYCHTCLLLRHEKNKLRNRDKTRENRKAVRHALRDMRPTLIEEARQRVMKQLSERKRPIKTKPKGVERQHRESDAYYDSV